MYGVCILCVVLALTVIYIIGSEVACCKTEQKTYHSQVLLTRNPGLPILIEHGYGVISWRLLSCQTLVHPLGSTSSQMPTQKNKRKFCEALFPRAPRETLSVSDASSCVVTCFPKTKW